MPAGAVSPAGGERECAPATGQLRQYGLDVRPGGRALLAACDQRRGGLLRHWALEDGLPLERERVGELRQGLLRAHGRELDRLRGLPYALETEDFLFVHSGVKTPDYRNTPPQLLTKFNDFFFLARPIGKWVVFGHMPANNFQRDGRMTPYVDKGRKLIAIDGGNAINRFGQLNGLLIEKRAGELFFETIFADAHGRGAALRSVRGLERKDCAATSYLDGRIERVLSENAHFVLCSLKRSGQAKLYQEGMAAEARRESW